MGCNLCKNAISPHHEVRPDDIEMTEPIIERMTTNENEPTEVTCRKFQPPISHTSSSTAQTVINTDHQRIREMNSSRNSNAIPLHENAHTQQSSQSRKTKLQQSNDAFVRKKQKSNASQPDSTNYHKMNRLDPGILRSSTPVSGSKNSDHSAEHFSTQTAYPFSINISPIQNVSDDELQLHHRTLVVKRHRKRVQQVPKISTTMIKELVLPDVDEDKHQLIPQNTSKIRSTKLMQQILQNDIKSKTDEWRKSEYRKAVLIRQIESSSDDD